MFNKLLFSFLLLFILFSCKKGDTGGSATVTTYVNHHGKAINLPVIYVKFDAKKQPSDPTNDYDLKVQGSHENHVHIKELRYGNYYLYATGFDSTSMQNVKGGIALKIKWSERRTGKEVQIEVSE